MNPNDTLVRATFDCQHIDFKGEKYVTTILALFFLYMNFFDKENLDFTVKIAPSSSNLLLLVSLSLLDHTPYPWSDSVWSRTYNWTQSVIKIYKTINMSTSKSTILSRRRSLGGKKSPKPTRTCPKVKIYPLKKLYLMSTYVLFGRIRLRWLGEWYLPLSLGFYWKKSSILKRPFFRLYCAWILNVHQSINSKNWNT